MHTKKPTRKSIERAIQRAKEIAKEKHKEVLYNNYLLLLAIVLTACMFFSNDFSYLPDDQGALNAAMAFIWAPFYILYRVVGLIASKTNFFNT